MGGRGVEGACVEEESERGCAQWEGWVVEEGAEGGVRV
jgi:hypothetical protein